MPTNKIHNPLKNRKGEEEERARLVGKGRREEAAFSSTKRTNPFNPFCQRQMNSTAVDKALPPPSPSLCPFLSLDLLLLLLVLPAPPFSPLALASSLFPLPGKPVLSTSTGGTSSSFFSPPNFHSWIKRSFSLSLSLFRYLSFFDLFSVRWGRESRDGLAERRQNVRQILLDGVINWGKRVKRLIRRWRGGVRWIGDDKYLARECFGCVPRLT